MIGLLLGLGFFGVRTPHGPANTSRKLTARCPDHPGSGMAARDRCFCLVNVRPHQYDINELPRRVQSTRLSASSTQHLWELFYQVTFSSISFKFSIFSSENYTKTIIRRRGRINTIIFRPRLRLGEYLLRLYFGKPGGQGSRDDIAIYGSLAKSEVSFFCFAYLWTKPSQPKGSSREDWRGP